MEVTMEINEKDAKDIMKRLFVAQLLKKKVILPKELVKIFEKEADKYFKEYKKEAEWQNMFKYVKTYTPPLIVIGLVVVILMAIAILLPFFLMVYGG